jgi:cytochrome c oxidase subunit IV
MSATDHTSASPAPAQDVGHPDAEHEHPSDGQYVKIALILAAVTLIEVLLYYWSIPDERANNAALLVLALIKFVMVAAFFMHLRFDNRLLRRLFIAGFILAIFCYIAYLLTMGVFIG